MVKRTSKATETKKKTEKKGDKAKVAKTQPSKLVKKEKKNKKEEESRTKKDITMEEEEEESVSEEISQENKEETEAKENKLNPKSRAARTQAAIEEIEHPQLTGVVYIGHLPWGFEESGLKKYFQQFGDVKRLIVPRSSQTGRSKGYAFIEFDNQETAKIAAKTMHNYILFDRVLKCNVVEDKTRYSRIFAKWNKKFKFANKYKMHLNKQLQLKTKEEIKAKIKLILEKEDKRREKFKELGLDYSFPGFRAIVDEYRKKHFRKGSKDNIKNKKEKETEEKKKIKKEDDSSKKRKPSDDKPIKSKKK